MTETELRQKVVTTAKKYLGCKESDGNHRHAQRVPTRVH